MSKPRLPLLLAIAATAVAMAAPGVASAAETVTACGGSAECAGTWVNHSVAVSFSWTDSGTGETASPECAGTTVSSDGDESAPGHTITCTVTYPDSTVASATATVKIDTAPPSLVYSPPSPNGANGWFITKPVVSFSWTDPAPSSGIGCSSSSIPYPGGDTPSAAISIPGCSDGAGNHSDGTVFSFKYDGTAPSIAGGLSRAPDHNGWYNHAVGVGFTGSDGTSGIAGCSGNTTYSGPDDSTALVKGTCTDIAGNSASKTVTFKYDDDPPGKSTLYPVPANKAIDLSWVGPSDADSYVITRAPAVGSMAPIVVYQGSGTHFIDSGLRNGVKYNYLITTYDAAGNASVSGRSAVPDGSSLRPFIDTEVHSPPQLTWKRIHKARYYNVQLFKGRKKVLSTWPTRASLQLRSSWKYSGHRYKLTPGLYRWYVWPGFGSVRKHKYGSLIGSSTFRVAG
jgi:hypothetical protein